jgi:hypothetical protein
VSDVLLPRGVAAEVERRLTPEPERPLPQDPVAWIHDELNEYTWSHQRKVLRSVVEHRRTAWKACHGPGKSYTASRLAAWWIRGHPPGTARVITSAPSGDQVRKILWSEIRDAHVRGGLPGHITDAQVPEWKIDGRVVAFGRKPQDYSDPRQAMTQFQGYHDRYLLVILDESSGIPEWLWDAVTTVATNAAARIIAIGNPDDPTTRFEKICRPGSGWNVITTSAFETPNFTGEYVPEDVREKLVSKLWVEERRAEWGEQHPYWTSKVRGEFPDVADNVVITPRMIREAHARDLPGLGKGRLAMDVARHGEDESAIYRNRDGVIRMCTLPTELPPIDRSGTPDPMVGRPAVWRKADTTVSRQRVEAVLRALGAPIEPIEIIIDVVGLGWAIFDPLRRSGFLVRAFVAGEKARDKRRFVNKRTEAWWMAREALEAGLWDLDPDDQVLAAQLQQPRWKEDAGKRIRLETKDEMATRGVKSPDRADTVVMTWYEGFDSVPDPAKVIGVQSGQMEEPTLTADLLDTKW